MGANTLDQRKAQAQPFATLLITAHKRLKHCMTFFFRNAYATVFDTETVLAQRQPNETPIGVVPGITQQVAHDRLQERQVMAFR